MKSKMYKWMGAWLALASLLALLPIAASASGGTSITFSPSSSTATVGDTVVVDVRINDAAQVYGAEVHISFDPARLQVLDDDPSQPGVQILPGSFFPRSDPSYIVQNQADNTAGTIDFAITLLAPESPLNGSGTLASIRFAAQIEGTAHLSWASTRLASNDGAAISHTTQDGQMSISSSVVPPPPPDPGKDCVDLIRNGGFEQTAYWDMPVTPHKANYSAADRYSGSRSVRLGIEPGSADVYSHSSAYQKIHVPANATSATLTFWARRFTQETPRASVDPTIDLYEPAQVIEGRLAADRGTRSQYDWQEALILRGGSYTWLATLMRARSNDGTWTRYSYDLSSFAGQDIVVYFNAINNGTGARRTWMYVDDVQVLSCYDSSPCLELVRNRSFEWTGDWTRAPTPRSADYTTDAEHTGVRSMRLGIVPPTGDTYSHSSAYQQITIPSGAVNPTLSFWSKAHSEDSTRSGDWTAFDWSGYDISRIIAGQELDRRCCGEVDWQEVLLLDASYRLLSGGVVLRQVRNDAVWQQKTFDLSPYRGMTIVLYLNAINDGNGRRTSMYVDDVSVNLCGHQARFDPTTSQVSVGQTFTVNARLESIIDLYGFETTIRFDPALLEVVDADPGTSGVQVKRGDWLPGAAHTVVNTVDNGAGRIDFAATLVSPTPPLNGSGNIVSIPFRAKAAGSTPVAYHALKLVNSSAQIIPITRSDGSVTVTGNQATLTGQVLLEGRADHSGTIVQLDGGTTVTTGADGRYSFSTTGGSHSIKFTRDSYLWKSVTVTAVAGSTTTVPTVTLLAGDINGDGVIDILDLSVVGSQFGSSSPSPAAADVNGDGIVDIVDFVLLAKNFGARA